MRLKIIRIGVILSFLFILGGLIYTQILKGGYYYYLSKNNRIRIVSLEGWRGRIMDRKGRVLADNRLSYNILVTPQDIQDIQKLFQFLSNVLDEEPKDLIERFRKNKTTPFAPVLIAQDIDRTKVFVLEENKYRFPSLTIQEDFRRFYPGGKSSAHVVGYVGKANRFAKDKLTEYGYSPESIIGYSGIEEYYDALLKGGIGGYQVEVDHRGKQVRLLSIKEPAQGQDITLTIDKDLQQTAYEVLDNQRGVIIVMDTLSGELLCLTSSPSFDPNVFANNDYSKMKSVFSSAFSPMLNRAISGVFPPGSVFKVPVALCALDTKKISEYTTFECKGFYELANTRFGCTHVHGPQNLVESLAHSCNVYYYHLALILGADQIGQYAKIMGLGRKTQVDLPYEKEGQIPSRRQRLLSGGQWYTGQSLNLAIGQGDVLVTPIQLVNMMATVAEEGVVVQPHLIKAIGPNLVNKYNVRKRVKMDKLYFQIIKKGLRAAVVDYSGTAHTLNLPDIYVAGKTGTAQITKDQEHHSWFAGYAKGKTRKIAFCVFLEHGGSSQNACLLARQFLIKMNEKNML